MPDNRDKKYPRVNFRLGTQLEVFLKERTSGGESPVSVAKRDLERYYDMLIRSLPTFSQGEAMLLVDVLNGIINMPYSVSLLWASVSDSLQEGKAELWEVDGPALVEKLRKLTPFECMAVADAVERAWNDSQGYRITNMDERVKLIGLVKD